MKLEIHHIRFTLCEYFYKSCNFSKWSLGLVIISKNKLIDITKNLKNIKDLKIKLPYTEILYNREKLNYFVNNCNIRKLTIHITKIVNNFDIFVNLKELVCSYFDDGENSIPDFLDSISSKSLETLSIQHAVIPVGSYYRYFKECERSELKLLYNLPKLKYLKLIDFELLLENFYFIGSNNIEIFESINNELDKNFMNTFEKLKILIIYNRSSWCVDTSCIKDVQIISDTSNKFEKQKEMIRILLPFSSNIVKKDDVYKYNGKYYIIEKNN